MSRKPAPLFRPDGTLKGVTFLRASGARPDVLFVVYRRPDDGRRMATSISLHRADFYGAYRRAVRVVADGLGLSGDAALVERMQATVGPFMQAEGLRVARVSYMQVYSAGGAKVAQVDPKA